MRHRSLAAVLATAVASQSLACDDHHGTCEVEDWIYNYTPMMQSLVVDGVATCDVGEVRLRLCGGEGGDRKLGVSKGRS